MPGSPSQLSELPSDFALAGVERGSLAQVLGRPSLSRVDWPAEYRRYDFGGCTLDLYLYQDPTAAVPRVSYWEVRSTDFLSAAGSDHCRWLSERLGDTPPRPSNQASVQ